MGKGSASPMDSLQMSGTVMTSADLSVLPLYSTPLQWRNPQPQLFAEAAEVPESGAAINLQMRGIFQACELSACLPGRPCR